MKIDIRKATPQQSHIVAAILSDAAKYKIDAHNDNAWPTNFEPGWVKPAAEREVVYIAYSEGQAVGTIGLEWEDGLWGSQVIKAGYIHKLAVKSDFHGQGIGKQIIDWAAGEVAAKGFTRLRLDCDSSNQDLCAYYERLGFKRIGKVKVKREHESFKYTAALYEKEV